jgi:RHS repeat-associated protein
VVLMLFLNFLFNGFTFHIINNQHSDVSELCWLIVLFLGIKIMDGGCHYHHGALFLASLDAKKRKLMTLKTDSTYGPDEDRIKSVLTQNGTLKRTNYYAGLYEKAIVQGGETKEMLYVPAGDGLAAVYIKSSTSGNKLYYIHKDYQGSIMCLSDSTGTPKEQYNYDPWGRRRNPSTWDFTSVATPTYMSRGYTGHEHLDEFSLINMNGRVYDPVLGIFLSPDNYVQAPDMSLNFNRYSYCLNNPLKYTDPSGEIFGFDDAVVILAMAYFGGVESNYFYNAKTGGNPFNPGDWNWKSSSTYIGIGSGAITGAGMAGYQIPTLFSNIDGIITRGVFQAGVNVGLNGIGNTINGDPFFDNWGGAALSGFVNGAIQGYQLAEANGTNYWWGTESDVWGYGRSQRSFAWWAKNRYVLKYEGGTMDMAPGTQCDARDFSYIMGGSSTDWQNKFQNVGVTENYQDVYKRLNLDYNEITNKNDFEALKNAYKNGYNKLIIRGKDYGYDGDRLSPHQMAAMKAIYKSNSGSLLFKVKDSYSLEKYGSSFIRFNINKIDWTFFNYTLFK